MQPQINNMQPRIPREPLNRGASVNIPLIAIAWTLVAVKVFGLAFMGFSLLASGVFEVGYTVAGVVLIRSANRTNKVNGWILVCYELFQVLLGAGQSLSHPR